MAYERDETDGSLRIDTSGPVIRFDEGRAIADRLESLDDDSEKESFDDVFAEFDEQFQSEQ
jgi:hypothetical protein